MFFGFFGLPLVLIVGALLLALAGKSEPDPKRERPAALYLAVATLVGVVLFLGATWLTANGLVELTDTDSNRGFSYSVTGESSGAAWSDHPPGKIPEELFNRPGLRQRADYVFETNRGGTNHDDDVSQVVGGVILGALAFAIVRFHQPKLQELADDSDGPGARIYSRHLYIVCGATLLTALTAAGTTVYGIYGMVAPDTAGAGEVTDAFRMVLSTAALAAVATLIFNRNWTRAEDLAAVARPPIGFAPAPPAKAAPAKKAAAKKAAPPTS